MIAIVFLIVLILTIFLYIKTNHKIDTSDFNANSVYVMSGGPNVLPNKKLIYIDKIEKIFKYYKVYCIIDNQQRIIYTKGYFLWYEHCYAEPSDFIGKYSKKYFLDNYEKIPSDIL